MGIIRTQKEKSTKAGSKQSPRVAAQSRPTKPTVTAAIKSAVTQSQQQQQIQLQSHASTSAASNAWWVSDVTFIVEGKRLQGHKVVLSSRSKYFAMLFMTSNQSEFVIKDFSHEVFSQFIRWVYAGSKEVPASAAVDLMKCAEQYDVPDLLQVCERALLSFQPNSPDTDGSTDDSGEGMNIWSHDPVLFKSDTQNMPIIRSKSGLQTVSLSSIAPASIGTGMEV